jgi:uncharacterized coiled-coil protein SlyX
MDRADELEVKVAYLERNLAELDAVVQALYEEVAQLRRALEAMRAAAAAREEARTEAAEPGIVHERPPHY